MYIFTSLASEVQFILFLLKLGILSQRPMNTYGLNDGVWGNCCPFGIIFKIFFREMVHSFIRFSKISIMQYHCHQIQPPTFYDYR